MINTNKDTGYTVDVVTFDRDGRNYYGACEVCGKPMSEVAIIERHKIFKHVRGFLYLSSPDAASYTHMGCKISHGRMIIDKKTMPRNGELLELPLDAFDRILRDIGFDDDGIKFVFDGIGVNKPLHASPPVYAV